VARFASCERNVTLTQTGVHSILVYDEPYCQDTGAFTVELTCLAGSCVSGLLFLGGFESAGTQAWSSTLP
jgi:hypothetical protein